MKRTKLFLGTVAVAVTAVALYVSNNVETISFPTNSMIFGVARFISAMSRYLTLVPGDMIWMGTEGHSKNMKVGDICEIEINEIGTLRNPIILGN